MQGTAAQLTKHKRFQRSFELSEGDVQLPKLFRQTVPQSWKETKQRSSDCLHDLLTKHVRLSADRKGQQPAAVTSIHSSATYTGTVPANE